jgi:hypothetical protein
LTIVLVGLGGCFAIPTPYHPTDDPNVPGKIPDVAELAGSARSDRPVKVDVSTKVDVRQVLGEPSAVSNDQRVWVYAQAMSSGWGFNFIGFPGIGTLQQRTQYVRLRFDQRDVLREESVSHGESRAANLGYAEYPQPERVPPELLQVEP